MIHIFHPCRRHIKISERWKFDYEKFINGSCQHNLMSILTFLIGITRSFEAHEKLSSKCWCFLFIHLICFCLCTRKSKICISGMCLTLKWFFSGFWFQTFVEFLNCFGTKAFLGRHVYKMGIRSVWDNDTSYSDSVKPVQDIFGRLGLGDIWVGLSTQKDLKVQKIPQKSK